MTDTDKDILRISEIFGPTIQGEGALIGRPTVFVRTGGCDYRCGWCDTMYAVDSKYRAQWKPMTFKDVMGKVRELSSDKPMLVTLSGGNPAIQNLEPLIRLGQVSGYQFAMETQGSVAQDWFSDLDFLTLSPKPPSSGMETDWGKFDDCLAAAAGKPATSMKIVVFDEVDYDYACDAAVRYPDLPLYLQPCNPVGDNETECDRVTIDERLRWLAEKVTNDNNLNAFVLPQLHVMIWGNKRGV